MINNISQVSCGDCKIKMELVKAPKGNFYQCPKCKKYLPLTKAPVQEKQSA